MLPKTVLYTWTSRRTKAKSSLSVPWNKNERTPHTGDEVLGVSKYLLHFLSTRLFCVPTQSTRWSWWWTWMVLALTLTPRYQHFPCSCLSFLVHAAPARCMAAAAKEKCCFMSWICPSRCENSARKAARGETPPCSQPGMALGLFLKGAGITLIVGLGFGA